LNIGQGSTFGGKKYTDNKSFKLAILEYGLHYGINLVDTGENYEGGLAEEIVGEFIKGKRSKVFVSDKFAPINNGNVIKACENSLKNLQTDYIDLYSMQWTNPEIPLSETLGQLETLKQQGKIVNIGVCNLTFNEFKQTNASYLQSEFSLSNREALNEVIPYCLNRGKTFVAYNIFNQGHSQPPEYIKELSKKYNKTPYQIILAWALSKGIAVLTNTMDFIHLQHNLNALELKLEPLDLELIDKSYVKPIEIPINEIKVIPETVDDSHKVYTTLEEVLKNADSIKPNPYVLAEEIKKNGLLKPVEVKRVNEGYQLIHGSQRFFAWQIAFNKPIPCFVI